MGSCGSKRITRFQIVYTSGASAIGVPGCPDLACWTASIESVRIVLIANCTTCLSSGMDFSLTFFCFQGSHFAQASQVSFGLTEVCGEKRFDQIPGDGRSHGPAAHTKNIHVIIFDTLPRRKMVFDQRGVCALDLVGTDGGADTASTNCNAAVHHPCHDRPGQWNDEVGVIIVRRQLVGAKIDYLVTHRTKLCGQFLLQLKPAVIGGDSNAHIVSPSCSFALCRPHSSPAAAWSARTRAFAA